MEKSNKWLVGVLTTLGTGIVLWWLTHEGGPLNHGRPAHLAVIAWKYAQGPNLADLLTSDGQLTIHNDGEVTAENCKVYDGRGDLLNSTPFGVPPKEDVAISVTVAFRPSERIPNLGGFGSHAYRATAGVRCDKDVSSNVFETNMMLK